MIRDSLSTKEMEDLVRVREMISEGCRLNAISTEELYGLLNDLNATFASMTTILTARRSRLTKLMAAIVREREKVKASIDVTNLTAPENIIKLERLEKLISDYNCLNEGFRRSRGGKRSGRSGQKIARKR